MWVSCLCPFVGHKPYTLYMGVNPYRWGAALRQVFYKIILSGYFTGCINQFFKPMYYSVSSGPERPVEQNSYSVA